MHDRCSASIVIPTRNRPHLLPLTLSSVLAQRDVDMDIIVVDDGDGGETDVIVQQIGDARIRLIRNTEPQGGAGARNCGVRFANRPWVAFCDDDDLWAPRKLAQQLATAHEEHAEWAYAGHVTVDLNLRVVSGSPPHSADKVMRDLQRHNSIPAGASNVVVRAEVLARAGPFDTSLRTSEDWDQWIRIARIAGPPACVSRPLVALRMHAGMVSRSATDILNDIEVIARRYRIPVDRARHHRWAAWMALEEGQRFKAVRHYAGAVAVGDWRSAGRAIVAVLDPGIVHRHRISADESWAREAQIWLDALRASRAHLAKLGATTWRSSEEV